MDELSKRREEKKFNEDAHNFTYACGNCGCLNWRLLKSGELECADCQSILAASWAWDNKQ